MKTKIVKEKNEQFKPISIEITFESQRELDAFGSLCNTNPVIDAMQEIGGEMPHYSVLKENGANIDKCDNFLDALKNSPYIKSNWFRD